MCKHARWQLTPLHAAISASLPAHSATCAHAAQNAAKKREVDYSSETLWREVAPARADLIANVVLGATLVWLPLTASAIGRCAFVKYRITDKRLVVKTEAPWKSALVTFCHDCETRLRARQSCR